MWILDSQRVPNIILHVDHIFQHVMNMFLTHYEHVLKCYEHFFKHVMNMFEL